MRQGQIRTKLYVYIKSERITKLRTISNDATHTHTNHKPCEIGVYVGLLVQIEMNNNKRMNTPSFERMPRASATKKIDTH